MARKPIPLADVLVGIESEDHFERRVTRMAQLHRWCGYHIRYSVAATRGVHRFGRDGHACGMGFPDWVFVKPGHPPKYRELKTERGRLTREQMYWQALLKAAGADVGVWRPSMTPSIMAEFGVETPLDDSSGV